MSSLTYKNCFGKVCKFKDHNSATTYITRQKIAPTSLHLLMNIHAKYQVILMETEGVV